MDRVKSQAEPHFLRIMARGHRISKANSSSRVPGLGTKTATLPSPFIKKITKKIDVTPVHLFPVVVLGDPSIHLSSVILFLSFHF